MKKIIIVIIITIIAILLISSAKVVDEREGYKIKVIKDTIEGNGTEESILFISPEGEIIRKLKRGICPDKGEGTIISKNGEYALYSEIIGYNRTGEGGHPEGLVSYRIIKYNIRGEEIFEKEYKTVFEDYANFNTKAMSENGDRILLYYVEYNDEKETVFKEYFPKNEENIRYRFNLMILDEKGNELLKKRVPPLGDRQISPDGKIVGGRTTKLINGKWYRHLYFLNVDTGEEKICKAEGEGWIGGAGISNITPLPPSGKIAIGVYKFDGPSGKRKIIAEVQKVLTFNEIPEDLSVLFQQEGDQ